MADAVVADLRAGLPGSAVLDDPDVVAGYARDMAVFAPSQQPRCVVFPADTGQVRHVLRVAARHRVPVVPRGAGSGLAGSANGVAGGITMVLTRMDRILEIDPANRLAVVEPGVVNLDLRRALEPHGLFFPPDPSSYDWCTIRVGGVERDSGRGGDGRDHQVGEAVPGLPTGSEDRRGDLPECPSGLGVERQRLERGPGVLEHAHPPCPLGGILGVVRPRGQLGEGDGTERSACGQRRPLWTTPGVVWARCATWRRAGWPPGRR